MSCLVREGALERVRVNFHDELEFRADHGGDVERREASGGGGGVAARARLVVVGSRERRDVRRNPRESSRARNAREGARDAAEPARARRGRDAHYPRVDARSRRVRERSRGRGRGRARRGHVLRKRRLTPPARFFPSPSTPTVRARAPARTRDVPREAPRALRTRSGRRRERETVRPRARVSRLGSLGRCYRRKLPRRKKRILPYPRAPSG